MKKLMYAVIVTILLIGCSGKSDKELYNQADKDFKAQKFDFAIENYKKIIDEKKESPYRYKSLLTLASYYHETGGKTGNKENIKLAADYYKIAAKEYADSSEAPRSLFLAAFITANEIKDYPGARKLYEEFINKFPTHEMAKDAKVEIEIMGKSPDEIINGK